MKKITSFFVLLALIFGQLNAQINLEGESYTQNFDQLEDGIPTGWKISTKATASALGEDAIFNADQKGVWNGTGGGFKNYASGTGMQADATNGEQDAATNRALGVRQTGSIGDPGAAFVMQIANTADRNSFQLKFQIQSLDASSPRTTKWQVQYAYGNNPTAFTNLITSPEIISTGGETFSNTEINLDFGSAIDNINQPVWIRIVALANSTGGGNRTTTAIDDVELTWTNGPATTVSAPIFSPAPGTFYVPQNVVLSTTTDGATIYYTIDGSTPDQNSTEYTEAINITETTTIKAIAYKDGLDESGIAVGEFVIETGNVVNSIAELRAKNADNSTIYTLSSEAILTYAQSFNNQKFVQDETGAIMIHDQAGNITTEYQIGEGISNIVGKLDSYFDMLQFIPISDPGDATSMNNVVTPEVFTLEQMQDNEFMKEHQAKLIRIEDVKFQEANGTNVFNVNKKYVLAQGETTDSTFKTTFYDANYINGIIPAGKGTIDGILHLSHGVYQITSRSTGDFALIVGIENNSKEEVKLYPNPATDRVNLQLTEKSNVVLTNLLGQTVVQLNNVNGLTVIDTSLLNRGVYFVTIFTGNEKTTRKLTIE